MRKLLLLIFLFISIHINAQEQKNQGLDIGITVSSVNLGFYGIDFDFTYLFWQKKISRGTNSLGFKNTLLTFVPANAIFPTAPYILFGGVWELQYRLTLNNGFHLTYETGLGVAAEFFQTEVFTIENGFQRNNTNIPYGLFSFGSRMGYSFEPKYNTPIILSTNLGYRLQYPYNLSVKHLIYIGASLSYVFNFN